MWTQPPFLIIWANLIITGWFTPPPLLTGSVFPVMKNCLRKLGWTFNPRSGIWTDLKNSFLKHISSAQVTHRFLRWRCSVKKKEAGSKAQCKVGSSMVLFIQLLIVVSPFEHLVMKEWPGVIGNSDESDLSISLSCWFEINLAIVHWSRIHHVHYKLATQTNKTQRQTTSKCTPRGCLIIHRQIRIINNRVHLKIDV